MGSEPEQPRTPECTTLILSSPVLCTPSPEPVHKMAAASPESVYKMAAIPVSPVEACANQLVSSLADTPMVLVRAASILKPPVSMTGPIASTEPARLIMSTEPAGPIGSARSAGMTESVSSTNFFIFSTDSSKSLDSLESPEPNESFESFKLLEFSVFTLALWSAWSVFCSASQEVTQTHVPKSPELLLTAGRFEPVSPALSITTRWFKPEPHVLPVTDKLSESSESSMLNESPE